MQFNYGAREASEMSLRAFSSIISLLQSLGQRADFLTALEPDIKQQETVPRDREEDHHGPEDDCYTSLIG